MEDFPDQDSAPQTANIKIKFILCTQAILGERKTQQENKQYANKAYILQNPTEHPSFEFLRKIKDEHVQCPICGTQGHRPANCIDRPRCVETVGPAADPEFETLLRDTLQE